MGNFQTNLSRATINSFTQYLNENITTITNTARANCVAGNIIQYTIGGEKCPPITIENLDYRSEQNAAANCELNAQFVSQINTKIESTIQNIVKSFIDQDLQNKQGFFALAFSGQANIAEQTQNISNRIANYVNNNIENYCGVSSIATNESNVTLCAQVINAKINLKQDASATAFVNCVSNAVVDAFIKDQTLNDLVIKANQKAASEQQGLNSILIYLIIAGAIILVLAVIGLVIYYFVTKPSGGATGTNTTVNIPPQLLQAAALAI